MTILLAEIQGPALSHTTESLFGSSLEPLLLVVVQQLLNLGSWLPLLVALLVSQPKRLSRGLVALALLLLPMIWLGHFWHPGMVLGAFLAAYWARPWGVAAAEATMVFGLLATMSVALANDVAGSTSSWPLAASNLRALVNAALLAAIADVLAANFVLRRTAPFVFASKPLSIVERVRNGSNLLFIVVIAIPATNELISLTGLVGKPKQI